VTVSRRTLDPTNGMFSNVCSHASKPEKLQETKSRWAEAQNHRAQPGASAPSFDRSISYSAQDSLRNIDSQIIIFIVKIIRIVHEIGREDGHRTTENI
jgi:hypothetical protein